MLLDCVRAFGDSGAGDADELSVKSYVLFGSGGDQSIAGRRVLVAALVGEAEDVVTHEVGGVCERRVDRVSRQDRVCPAQCLAGDPGGEIGKDYCNGDSSALYASTAMTDVRVDGDERVLVHDWFRCNILLRLDR